MTKKFIAFFLILILGAATLAGCGGKVDPSDPNQGLWTAKTGEARGLTMDVDEMFGQGFTIELQSKGKCKLTVDSKNANGTWALDGSTFTVKGGGIDCQGTLANGSLVLKDVMGMGVTLYFEKEGGAGRPAADTDSGLTSDAINGQNNSPAEGAEPLPEGIAWWDGSWYGWINILESHGDLSEIGGLGGDCYAYMDMKSGGTGTMYLWGDYSELGTIDIVVDLNKGDGMMGEMKSVSGIMFNPLEIEDGHWFVDPTDKNVDNLIYIYSDARTSNDDYARYEIYLRPWGTAWDDMEESLKPPAYDYWYVGDGFIDYASMLTALANTTISEQDVFVHPDLPAKAYASGDGGTDDQVASPTNESLAQTAGVNPVPVPAPSGGGIDYEAEGKQDISSDRVSEDKLIEAYKNIDAMSATEKSNMTYEDVKKIVGCEASQYNKHLSYRMYTWLSAENDFAKFGATFTEEGGEWKGVMLGSDNLGLS